MIVRVHYAYQLPSSAEYLGQYKRLRYPNRRFPLYRLADGIVVNDQGVVQDMSKRVRMSD